MKILSLLFVKHSQQPCYIILLFLTIWWQSTFAAISFPDAELLVKTIESALQSACGIQVRIVQFELDEINAKLIECIYTKTLEEAGENILESSFANAKKLNSEKFNVEQIQAAFRKFYDIARKKAQQFVAKFESQREKQFFAKNQMEYDDNGTTAIAPMVAAQIMFNLVFAIQMFQFAYATMFQALHKQLAAQSIELTLPSGNDKARQKIFHLYHQRAVLNHFAKNVDFFETKLRKLTTGTLAPEREFVLKQMTLNEKLKRNEINSTFYGTEVKEEWAICHGQVQKLIQSPAYANRLAKYRSDYLAIVKAISWETIPVVKLTPEGIKDLPLIDFPALNIDEALQLLNQLLETIMQKNQLKWNFLQKNSNANKLNEFLLSIVSPKWHPEEKIAQQQYSTVAEAVVKKLVNLIELAQGSWQFCCGADLEDATQKEKWENEITRVKVYVFAGLLIKQFESLRGAKNKRMLLLEDEVMDTSSVKNHLKSIRGRHAEDLYMLKLAGKLRAQYQDFGSQHSLSALLFNKAEYKLRAFMFQAKQKKLPKWFLEQFELNYQRRQVGQLTSMHGQLMTMPDAERILRFVFVNFVWKQIPDGSSIALLQNEMQVNSGNYSTAALKSLQRIIHFIQSFHEHVKQIVPVGNAAIWFEQIFMLTVGHILLKKLMLVQSEKEIWEKLTVSDCIPIDDGSMQMDDGGTSLETMLATKFTNPNGTIGKLLAKIQQLKRGVKQRMEKSFWERQNPLLVAKQWADKNMNELLTELSETMSNQKLREEQLRPYLHVWMPIDK